MKSLILNPFTAKLLIKPVLKLHNLFYKLAGRLGCLLNNGQHPKRDIIKYDQWFLNHIESGWTVLDVGSHMGEMAKSLSKKAGLVYGIEIVKEWYERSKIKNPGNNIEYFYGDARLYDFSNTKKIDCVTMSNILEHVEGRIDFLKKLVKNIPWAGVKAKFFIRVPLIERDWISVYKKQLGVDYRLDPTHFTEYTLTQFKDEISRSGLEIIQYDIQFGEIFAICEQVSEGYGN